MHISLRRCVAVGAVALLASSLASGQSRPGSSVPADPDRDAAPQEYPIKEIGTSHRRLDRWEPVGKGQRKLVAPSDEDARRFEAFLRGKETGLVRLFPYRDQKDEGLTVSAATGPLATVWGGGGFYSFTHRTHVSRQWTEILLTESGFTADVSRDSIGIIANLGSAPLESLTPESPGVATLARYAPERDRTAAGREAGRIRVGFRDGTFEYAAARAVEPGATYVLRSILYDRADSLVAFRVVRRADDGSVTLLWRRLRAYDTPRLGK